MSEETTIDVDRLLNRLSTKGRSQFCDHRDAAAIIRQALADVATARSMCIEALRERNELAAKVAALTARLEEAESCGENR